LLTLLQHAGGTMTIVTRMIEPINAGKSTMHVNVHIMYGSRSPMY